MNINFVCEAFSKMDGYGRHALALTRALVNQGIQVHPIATAALEWDGFIQRQAGFDFSRLTLSLIPHAQFTGVPGRQWGYTMWECTKIPAGWVTNINTHCERLLVPCQWNLDLFKEAGVQVPIHVIWEGIDPAEFPVRSTTWTPGHPFTFMAWGDRGSRKGWDTAYQAFYQAFADDPNVRLVIKTRKDGLMQNELRPDGSHRTYSLIDFTNGDRRISIWRADLDNMADAYVNADCLVFPSRGEGWGLPPREAAAMGIPAIVTRYGGLLEGLDNWGIPVGYTEVDSIMELGGKWAMADADEVAAKMKWVYENYTEARSNALKAAYWLRQNQTWAHAAKSLAELLRQHT